MRNIPQVADAIIRGVLVNVVDFIGRPHAGIKKPCDPVRLMYVAEQMAHSMSARVHSSKRLSACVTTVPRPHIVLRGLFAVRKTVQSSNAPKKPSGGRLVPQKSIGLREREVSVLTFCHGRGAFLLCLVDTYYLSLGDESFSNMPS